MKARAAESPRRATLGERRPARLWTRAIVTASTLLAATAVVLAVASPAQALPQLQSQGSSFAGVAIEQWVGQSSSLLGLNINFQITSSVLGLNAFAGNQVDFGASDIPYSSGQAQASPNQPFQYLPDVAGALAFMYNLTGKDGARITNLVLNASTVDGIFSGRISYWDDSAIKSINPLQTAENLPHLKIVPVVRQDASGESYLLSDYLLHEDGPSFEAFQGAMRYVAGQPSAQWPILQGGQGVPPGYPNLPSVAPQNGSDGVANYVSALSSDGSIGYLETAYAISHNFPVASLMNASGHAVQPTSFDDATALTKAILYADLTQNLTFVYSNPDPAAYPVSAYSYLVAACTPSLAAAQNFHCTGPGATSSYPADKGAEFGQFVHFLACDGQAKMAVLGYSPLPTNLVQEDFDAIGRINGGVQPAPPTPSTCANPYVTGALKSVGGPQIVGVAPGAADANQLAAAAANATSASNGAGSSSANASSGGKGGNGNNGTSTADGHQVPTKPLSSQFGRLSALQASAGGLRAMSPWSMVVWLVVFAVLLGGPLAILLVRRRRERGPGGPPAPGTGGAPPQESTNGSATIGHSNGSGPVDADEWAASGSR